MSAITGAARAYHKANLSAWRAVRRSPAGGLLIAVGLYNAAILGLSITGHTAAAWIAAVAIGLPLFLSQGVGRGRPPARRRRMQRRLLEAVKRSDRRMDPAEQMREKLIYFVENNFLRGRTRDESYAIAAAMVDAYARELAERQRAADFDWYGDDTDAAQRTRDHLADLIDPTASKD